MGMGHHVKKIKLKPGQKVLVVCKKHKKRRKHKRKHHRHHLFC
ncbi:hypothetical protein [Paenibacillus sp. J31TS4]|nr:hypothetical protein [Paenibacillus sp. J31TS4]